jgi:hypothetical protein
MVTSDHGQLIGERQKYDHNYFLDDELLRFPLYVRFPDGAPPLKQSGTHVSLIEIPKLVEGVVDREEVKLGADIALAECFGPHTDITFMWKDETERKLLEQSFFRRIKVYSRKGSVVYNEKTDGFEDLRGSPSINEAKAAVAELPLGADRSNVAVEFSREESEGLEGRLRDLGYL